MAVYIYHDGDNSSRKVHRHRHFGFDPEDLYIPLALSGIEPFLRSETCMRPWHSKNSSASSVVKREKDAFHVDLDVQQFKPEEITVKSKDNCIIVEGKHEDRQDEHGYISRHFTRRYVLPEDYEMDNVVSSLSSDGVLTISAPKISPPEKREKVIPIIHTGPHKTAKDDPKTPTENPEEQK